MDWESWDLVLMALIGGSALVILLWIFYRAAALGRETQRGRFVPPSLARDPSGPAAIAPTPPGPVRDPTIGRDQFQPELRVRLEELQRWRNRRPAHGAQRDQAGPNGRRSES